MDASINARGGYLRKAIPTVILLLFVHLYLKLVFFKPLEEVLRQRHAATEGAREAAAASLKMASEKTARYEAELQEARNQVYREQEEIRRRWVEEQAKTIAEAKATAKAAVASASRQIAAEVAAARQELASASGVLADQLPQALLPGRSSNGSPQSKPRSTRYARR